MTMQSRSDHQITLRSLLLAFTAAVAFTIGATDGLAQPQPRPTPQGLKPPLKLLSVSLNRGAQQLFHRLGNLPTPLPEFTVPRTPALGTNFVIDFHTRDGRGNISFSHVLPTGVQPNAFTWLQSSGQPPARGRLRYNFCAQCPSSFILEITAKDAMDFNGTPRTEHVRINLTPSDGPPRIVRIDRINQDRVRPQFRITFARRTFNTEDSTVVAKYLDGPTYRLIPQNVTETDMTVVIERLKVSRGVQVTLSNPLGIPSDNSNRAAVILPKQSIEANQFECINCSTLFSSPGAPAAVSPEDTATLERSGLGIGTVSGTDTIPLLPQRAESQCDQEDFVFTTARVAILFPEGLINPPVKGPGTVEITNHPPRNRPLRRPDNKITIHWTKPGWVDHWVYQVAPNGVAVVGTCNERIIH